MFQCAYEIQRALDNAQISFSTAAASCQSAIGCNTQERILVSLLPLQFQFSAA